MGVKIIMAQTLNLMGAKKPRDTHALVQNNIACEVTGTDIKYLKINEDKSTN